MKKVYRKFTTEESTILFPSLIEPKSSVFNPDQEPRYTCSFSLSQSDLGNLKKEFLSMAKECWDQDDLKNIMLCVKPQKIKDTNGEYIPRKDENGNPTFMLSSWSLKKPLAVDVLRNDLKEEDTYTGMKGVGIVTLYTLETRGRRFILAGLLAVVKTKDGERPRTSVDDDIAELLSKYTKEATTNVTEEIKNDVEIPF